MDRLAILWMNYLLFITILIVLTLNNDWNDFIYIKYKKYLKSTYLELVWKTKYY